MIEYFYISPKLFQKELLSNKDHWLFIFNLFKHIQKSTFNLVTNESFPAIFEKNKELILDNLLRTRIFNFLDHHIKNKKIRFIKKEIRQETLEEELLEYITFDKFIQLEDNNFNNLNHIFLDLKTLAFFEEESLTKIEQGELLNNLDEIHVEKLFLGSSSVQITVFNFFDNIFSARYKNKRTFYNGRYINKKYLLFDKKQLHEPKRLIERYILANSLNYICEKIINARTKQKNFLETAQEMILNINCKTMQDDNFYYENQTKIDEYFQNFVKYELKSLKFINIFFENGWKINLNLFSSRSEYEEELLAADETHDRYIQSDNGVFSIAKDLDFFSPIDSFRKIEKALEQEIKNKSPNSNSYLSEVGDYLYVKNISFKKKPIRIKISSAKQPFIALKLYTSYSSQINLNKFFS